MKSVLDLAEQWQTDAALLRRYYDEKGATVCELHAQELRDTWRDWNSELLPTNQAAIESGYSEEQLRRRFRGGSLRGVQRGARSRIYIRRCDLPRKKASRRRQADARTASDSYNVDEDARSIAERIRGA